MSAPLVPSFREASRRVACPLKALGLLLILLPCAALADDVTVVIGGFTGPGAHVREIGEFQTVLRELDGLKVKSTRQFKRAARRAKVQWKIPKNKRALRKVARALKLDAVIYLKSRKKRRDRTLTVSIYSGKDGALIKQRSIRVKRGHFKKHVWREVRELIKPDLGLEARAQPAAPPVGVEPVVAGPVDVEPRDERRARRRDDRRYDDRYDDRRDDRRYDDRRYDDRRDERRDDHRYDDRRYDDRRYDDRRDDRRYDDRYDDRRDDRRYDDRRYDDERRDGERRRDERRSPPEVAHPILVLHGGGAFRARHFQYALEYSEPEEAGLQTVNIDYSSSLVPGFAIDGEVYPLARLLEGFGRGLGIGLTYERVFLETNQEVESNEGIKVEALETNHSHFKGRLFYKHTFGEGFGLHPQIWGGLSYGLLNFTVEDNAEYNGVEYSYFGQSLGGSIPFGTPAVGLDIDLGILQADIGDTVEELGGSVNTFGIRGYLGYVGYFLQRISLKFGMEYTRMNQTVAGRGRPYGDLEGEYGPEHGRTGETAEDQYISFRLMIGYIL